jgi:DNA polymerase III delta prime subunit
MAVNVEMINGQSVNVDVVRNWTAAGFYRPLFGQCRVILVDEIDSITNGALNEIRSYLDRLPPATVFLSTTNKETNQLQPQLQSRFKPCSFTRPSDTELHNWLTAVHSVPADYASEIVRGAQGNVRAAKIDALAWKEAQQ